jgi:hypothetical protein
MKAHFAHVALLSVLSSAVLADRQLKVVNSEPDFRHRERKGAKPGAIDCDFKLFPAFFSAVNPPNAPTGWVAEPGDERSITLPTGWIGR